MREDKFTYDVARHSVFFSPSHKKGDFFMSKNKAQARNQGVKNLVLAALFCAIAYVATLTTSWITVQGFLTFDIKDAIIAISGLILGPLYTIIISLIVSLIEIIVIPQTGFWGFLMNFLSTAAFSFVCALIYKYKKNLTGAVVGIVTSILSMTAMMVLLNLLVTPIYTGMPTKTIAAMIPTLFLPFNFTKATLNGALVMILYKPISTALKASKMLPSNTLDADKKKPAKGHSLVTSLIVSGISLVVCAVCVAVFLLVLGGELTPIW